MKLYQCLTCENIFFENDENHRSEICDKHDIETCDVKQSESDEEHQITLRKIGNFVKVSVSNHPMIDLHHIEWIAIETNEGFYIKKLVLFEEPSKEFILHDEEEVLTIYVKCNLHHLFSKS